MPEASYRLYSVFSSGAPQAGSSPQPASRGLLFFISRVVASTWWGPM
jgi:hypothetical protein